MRVFGLNKTILHIITTLQMGPGTTKQPLFDLDTSFSSTECQGPHDESFHSESESTSTTSDDEAVKSCWQEPKACVYQSCVGSF